LVDFFQYLTQAVNKVDRCALVASLLASDPRKHDEIGREIAQGISDIFARSARRWCSRWPRKMWRSCYADGFSRQSQFGIRSRRAACGDGTKGLENLDEQIAKEGKAAEKRFLESYPFHPDLTDLFYSKWTQLEGFQKARGS